MLFLIERLPPNYTRTHTRYPSSTLFRSSQLVARLIGHDRAAVGGAQYEGVDHAALARYRLDAEIAPAVPASGRRVLLAIDPSLACDQDVGEEPVSLAPGRKN